MQRRLGLSRGLVVWVCVVALGTAASALAAPGDDVLIREVENLRDSLTLRDPGRAALTLRLADLYFDHAVDLGRKLDPTAQDQAELLSSRHKAIEMYQAALSGDSGNFQPASGSVVPKIHFQLARLFADLGKQKEAQALWQKLAEQTQNPTLRRESIVRLAEAFEHQNSPQAEQYYSKAIELCAGTDLCSYAHYRLAWIQYKRGETAPAVAEMKKALYDSKGQVREEAVRDLVLFMGHLPGNGQDALAWMEGFSNKISRPELIQNLSNSFYTAGNREAGTKVLEYVNRHHPSLVAQAHLMEQYYGSREWDSFRDMMSQASGSAGTLPSLSSTQRTEVEAILRRTAVQLDAERVTEPEHVGDFQTSVMLYLKLFPKSEVRDRMIDGWIAAEKDNTRKIAQLKTWIAEAAANGNPAQELRLREVRAAAAQKSGQNEIVAEEMAVLAARGKADKQREFRYVEARSLYALKKFDQALPLFVSLADEKSFPNGSPDQWATLSENLALDILNQQKNYGALVAQAALWTDSKALQANPDEAKDLADLHKIADQARFEQASLTPNADALATFAEFCQAGKIVPKSCDNAKVLALKLKDEGTLLAVLKTQKDEAALATEYESAGYFAEAATLQEKTAARELEPLLKISLLYELGGDLASRDRVIESAVKIAKAKKSLSPTEEAILWATLKETGKLARSSLALPWSQAKRLELASELEQSGHGDAAIAKLILSSPTEVSPAWAKLVLSELRSRDARTRKIGFYGRAGQRKFLRRLSALKSEIALADHYIKGASAETRVEIATILLHAHQDLAQEILQSPIPKGLAPEAVAQVQASLQQMAAPFQAKVQEYETLAREQLAKVADPDRHAALELALAASAVGQSASADTIANTQAAPVRAASSATVRGSAGARDDDSRWIARLHRNPEDREALAALQKFHQALGHQRLAAYFQGRLLQLDSHGGGKS